MATSTATHPSLLIPGLYQAAISTYQQAPKLRNKLAHRVTKDKGPYAEILDNPDLGRVLSTKVEGGGKTLISQYEGYIKRITPVVKAGYLEFTEEMLRDDQYDQMPKYPKRLGVLANETMEVDFFDEVFNNGFTSSTTADGQYVFDSDHTFYAGSATYSNLLTQAAFGVSSLWTALNAIRRKVDAGGKPIILKPKYLLHAIEITQKVKETLGSSYSPEDDRNAINALKEYNLTPISSPYLTSTTAWFIICEEHTIYHWPLWPVTFKNEGDFQTDNSLFGVKLRAGNGVVNGIGIYGNLGA